MKGSAALEISCMLFICISSLSICGFPHTWTLLIIWVDSSSPSQKEKHDLFGKNSPLLTEFGPLFGWGVQQQNTINPFYGLEATRGFFSPIGGTTQRWEECTTHGPLAILDGGGSGGWYMECKTTPRCWFQISFLMLLSPPTYLGKWSKLASILFKRVGFSSPTRKRCLAAGFNFQSRRVRMESARVVWLKMSLMGETTRWRSNGRLFVIIWLQWWFHLF